MARDNVRILKNSFYVYGRLLFTMFLTLYTSRVVLAKLGVEDYGTYNIVAGITVMFASIKSMFASAVQRFYNFEIGKEDDEVRLNLIFNIGLRIHVFGAIVLFCLLELIGPWLIANKLDIPNYNYFAAQLIFQFTIISTVLTMVSVPYDAMVIAREKMGFYAMISIIDAILKLGIALSLSLFNSNRLSFYGLFILGVSVVNFILLQWYSRKQFGETMKISLKKDRTMMKEIIGFSGWNFFGNMSFSLTNEVSNLFLNLFGGVTANAARGITYQIRGAVTSLLSNALVAVRPQATQEYAKGNKESFFNIIYFSTKAVFFISLIVITPLFLFTEKIIYLWLGQMPEYCVMFTRIMLLHVLIRSFHEPIDLVFKSSGHLRYYQLTSFFISIIGLPIIYLALRSGLDILCVFIGMCIMEFVEFVCIAALSSKEGLSLRKYLISSLIPIGSVVILTITICYMLIICIQLNHLVSFCIIMALIVLLITLVGFNKKERTMLVGAVKKIIG